MLATLLLLLGACASPPPPPPAPAPVPVQPSLAELMQQAHDAHAQGGKERARETWREASRSYPTSKEPWLKLAEDHFASADYGYAVLAAQEVSQRDPADRTAHSILAVAGLRVAAMALSALRGQQSGMPASTRSEAEGLTKLLRETLGEQILVPAVEPQPKPRAAVRKAAAPTKAGARAAPSQLAEMAAQAQEPGRAPSAPSAPAKPETKSSAKGSGPAPGGPTAAANPFDRLR